MDNISVKAMYSLDKTIAAELFEGCTYPWEVLPKIKDFIIAFCNDIS